ncbi:zinc-binding dehydrogenase [Chromobacterium sp. IIBBL 290-4]|uniref:zinc-binding dehydrogenase n=1 Tax=Chromobacterium sp. IIBBL 290-4 TaxID=2953890 RepID=UPI0020B75B87|nr:zinc-binding dehydrogenase [Chromobacterium sp. IIBBL 290-4]UTH72332.1 zinc-binding dehydrogenase [Chromobacterium sp. IIBBL 290-4]
MRAIVRQQYGGPEHLHIQDLPQPIAKTGEVLIRVRAFGLNRAEQYFRQGLWGEVAAISGIECAGEVEYDPSGRLQPGQKVIALMGGMGRSRNGSYAEWVSAPAGNVVPIRTKLDWAHLAALPESYATAWTCLHDNLALQAGDTLLIRGALSALGQAALQLAKQRGAKVIATVRHESRLTAAQGLGADEAWIESPSLFDATSANGAQSVDKVLDLVGTSTLLDSLRLAKRNGRVCMAGFLGGHAPLADFDPMVHLPSGRHLSFFASALVFGSEEYPLGDIPFQQIIDWAESGAIQAKPVRVFPFEEIQAAHRLLDAQTAGGKIVVMGGA